MIRHSHNPREFYNHMFVYEIINVQKNWEFKFATTAVGKQHLPVYQIFISHRLTGDFHRTSTITA
jgi:hypothetical protein